MPALFDAVESWAVQAPDDLAAIDASGAVTWSELRGRAVSLAEALRRAVPEGAARFELGRSVNDLALLAAADLSGIDCYLWASSFVGQSAPQVFLQRELVSARLDPAGKLEVEGSPPTVRGEPGAGRVGLLTSGTSGPPKCALHTWQSLAGAVTVDDRHRRRRWLAAYPLGAFSGLQVALQSLVSGGCLVIPATLGPVDGLAALGHSVECLCCTPTYFRRLLLTGSAAEWKGLALRQVTFSGEVVDQAVLDAARRALPEARISHVYGSTELGTVFSVSDGRAGFPARLLDGQRARLENGELFVSRGPRSMTGYSTGDAPLWFATGDLVELKGDRAVFVGRRSTTIHVAGYKVQPELVEEIIRGFEGVSEVAVSAKKSALVGNLVTAEIVLAPGKAAEALRAALIAHCRANLPPYAVPRALSFVDSLSTTTTLKVARATKEQT